MESNKGLENANPFAKGQRRARILTISIWGSIIVLIAGGYFAYTRSQQSSIVIVGLTIDASITLNGRIPNQVSDPRGIKLPVYAGRYRLAITRSDRLPFSQDITVPTGQTLVVRPVFGLYPSASGDVSGNIDFVRPTPDGKAVYYLGSNRSELFRMETSNQVSIPITTGPLGAISDVEWSSDPEVSLIVTPQGTALREITSYDFSTQRTVQVAGTEVLSPVWDPTNNQRIAAALFTKQGERSLVLSDRHFTQVDRKASLTGFNDPLLTWSPDGRYIGVIDRNPDASRNNLWVYTLADSSFRQLTKGGYVLGARFSPTGTSVVYSTLTNGSSHLGAALVSDGTPYPLTMDGDVSQVAWKDNSSFYLPDGSSMRTVSVQGTVDTLPYTGPDITHITTMFYFADQKIIVFATSSAIYTVDLSS
jgi:Eukaryotic translation initiation factor eIF2A